MPLSLPTLPVESFMSSGIVALLDLPVGTSLSIDGKVVTLKRDDFIGISGMPSNWFHLVTCKIQTSSSSLSYCDSHNNPSAAAAAAAPPHGFIMLVSESSNGAMYHGGTGTRSTGKEWIVAHRYDPRTEEVSATPIDAISAHNLQSSIRQQQQQQQQGYGVEVAARIIPYTQFFVNDTEREEWQRATCFISTELLLARNIFHGSKVVPGSYQGDDEPKGSALSLSSHDIVNDMNDIDNNDGRPLRYPPIPVLGKKWLSSSQHDDGGHSHWRTTGHAGTKRFLSTLSPGERTRLMAASVEDQTLEAIRYVLEHYCPDRNWRSLLGDLQLAFVMFLNLHCFASMEHWRDLIAMFCFIERIDEKDVDLYSNFATILQHQMQFMDQDLFEDMEFSSDNFFLPAI